MADVTRILNAIEEGNAKAADELIPLVYEELRLLAAQKMYEERPGQTLQATALVHEAYMRLVEAECQNWNSRNHFFMAAAEAMRRILVDNARRKQAEKRGGGQQRLTFDGVEIVARATPEEIVMIDEPSLGLAPRIVEQIFDIIKLFIKNGMTIILIEQNARKGLENSDWGCVLDLGQTMFEGPADTILSDPRIQELYLGKSRSVS